MHRLRRTRGALRREFVRELRVTPSPPVSPLLTISEYAAGAGEGSRPAVALPRYPGMGSHVHVVVLQNVLPAQPPQSVQPPGSGFVGVLPSTHSR